MYTLPEGGHELANVTYEITQIRFAIIEQSLGVQALTHNADRLSIMEDALTSLDSDSMAKQLELSRQERDSPLQRKKNETMAPILDIVVGGYRAVELRPGVLKLCKMATDAEQKPSIVWLSAESSDDAIALAKRRRWLPMNPEYPEGQDMEVTLSDQDVIKLSIGQLYTARDELKSQLKR